MSYPQVRKTAETRQKYSNMCTKGGRVDMKTKDGRAAAPTAENPALTTSKEWLMPRIPVTTDTRKLFAKELLHLSQLHYEEARALRHRRVFLAKEYGLTNTEIGEELGITEAAVRMIVKRADVQ